MKIHYVVTDTMGISNYSVINKSMCELIKQMKDKIKHIRVEPETAPRTVAVNVDGKMVFISFEEFCVIGYSILGNFELYESGEAVIDDGFMRRVFGVGV